jgi:hypothetical protein
MPAPLRPAANRRRALNKQVCVQIMCAHRKWESTDAEFFAAAGETKPVVRLLRRLAG